MRRVRISQKVSGSPKKVSGTPKKVSGTPKNNLNDSIYNMVMKCERCQVDFKYASLLARHQARKTLCEKVDKYETCKYCKKPLSSSRSKSRHEQICRYKDDYVRNLELELEIDINYEYSNNTCRFCDKVMRSNHLFRHECACKAKEIYKTKLQNMLRAHNTKQGKSGNTTINNIHNGNNNTINITLRPFGKENLEYITPSKILRALKSGRCQFTGISELNKFLAEMQKLVYINVDHPENHNMLIPSLKGSSALVYTDGGFEYINRRIAESKAIETINGVTYDNIQLENDDEREEEIRQRCREKYERFVKQYITEEIDENDAQNRQVIGQTSYTNREIVKATYKRMETEGKLKIVNMLGENDDNST